MLVVWARLRTLVAVPPLIIAFVFTCRFTISTPCPLSDVPQAQIDFHAQPAHVQAVGNTEGWALTPELDKYANKVLAAEHLPGLSIAAVRITEAGEVETDLAAWGRMNEDGEPIHVDTLFNIGSCSKAFLVTALGILMEDYALGRNVTGLPTKCDQPRDHYVVEPHLLPSGLAHFDWDTKIQDILPRELPPIFASLWARSQATLRDVLSHMSGIDFVYGDDESPMSLLQHLQHLRPVYELRERFSYANFFYTICAYIISNYSGMAYEDFVAQRIFIPLGMSSTTYSHAEAVATERLSQSWTASGRRVPLWLGNGATTAWAGPAGIISNAVDMSKWLATLLNGGIDPRTNITVIPRAVLDEMTTAHAVVFGRPRRPYRSIEGYGMGWERSTFQGHDIISHSGRMPAHLSEVLFLPSDKLGIVALSNADQPQEAHLKVAYRIIEDVLKLPHIVDPDVNPSTVNTIAQDDAHSDGSTTITLAASLTRYAGTYKNPAYGKFTLCAPTTRSEYCASVRADFAACGERGEHPALYAAYPRFTSSHIRLTPNPLQPAAHENIDAWELEFVSLFPHGYGKDTTPFVYRVLGGSTMEVRCAVVGGRVDGCGIVDVTLDEGRVLKEGTLKEVADVWFERVD